MAIVKNAGRAMEIECHSMLDDSDIMRVPTSISTGAVASSGIATTRGAKKIDSMKKNAMLTAVRPVLPPT